MPTISPFSKPGGGNQTAPEGDKEVDGPVSSRMKRPGTWKSSRLGPSKELRRAKMTKLRSMMRWGAAGLCLWGPAGCAPKIYRFDVLPYAVCVGTPSTVSWHIKGKPELTLTPPSQPISTKPLHGGDELLQTGYMVGGDVVGRRFMPVERRRRARQRPRLRGPWRRSRKPNPS